MDMEFRALGLAGVVLLGACGFTGAGGARVVVTSWQGAGNDYPLGIHGQYVNAHGAAMRTDMEGTAGADVRSAMETMRTAQVRRLPVTEGGKLAGILSIDDIARSGRWDMECAQALCGITANICRR